MQDLSLYFNEFFEVRMATFGWVLDETRRLRYKVYCKEEQFEDPARFPDGMEKDEHDRCSVHCLVSHRPTGFYIGTARLVLGADKALLPVELCSDDRFRKTVQGEFPRIVIAEPSRLALTGEFRRRHGETLTVGGIPLFDTTDRRKLPEPSYDRRLSRDRRRFEVGPPQGLAERRRNTDERRDTREERRHSERRVMPHLMLVLLRAAIEMSFQHQIEVWYALMEPAFLRRLKSLGLVFEPVGKRVMVGNRWRQPCRAYLPVMLNRVRDIRNDLWAMLCDRGRLDFEHNYPPPDQP